MQHRADLIQEPPPGEHRVHFCGDVVRFRLRVPPGLQGSAWLRTNLGHAAIARGEIVRRVHLKQTPLGRDWFDIPMHKTADEGFIADVALCEPGHFEAKCFFLEEGAAGPVWPPGPNAVVNVDAADSCAANIVYNAFVRQFGPNKSARRVPPPEDEACIQRLDALHFTVIPPSGTFRDLIAELDFILGVLGCRIVLLLPIHPTPTTYGRMGRFGSPYAALSFRSVDPALAVFDPRATPTEQFIELVDAVHRRNGRLFLDIAINHTGWAANLHNEHPEWLCRTEEGRIEVPGAWGVQWEDLTKLDYRHPELWRFMAGVFLTWCRRGVDGFRCDAGYMIPHEAWRYIVARVREEFPDTIFLLEGLGGKISVTRSLLDTANLNWAYSELFQNYDRSQIEHYLPEAIEIASREGLLVHFAETHDNPRLAATSHTWARLRTALCALSSFAGSFGFANGVEWYATEKIDVHDAVPLNWGAPVNQVDWIARLSRILKEHPAMHAGAEVRLVERGGGNHVVLLRREPAHGKRLLVLANLDPGRPGAAFWDPREPGLDLRRGVDLLTGETVEAFAQGDLLGCALEAGQVRCLSPDPADLEALQRERRDPFAPPPRVERQRLRAKALEVLSRGERGIDVTGINPEQAAVALQADPAGFLEQQGWGHRLTRWLWPRDLRREVMIPPDHFLLVAAREPFRLRVTDRGRTLRAESSIAALGGTHFCLLSPLPAPRRPRRIALDLRVHEPGATRHAEADLLLLPAPETTFVRRRFSRAELLETPRRILATNGRGAVARAAVAWGRLESRYDGLLAANPDPLRPVDRWMLFARCRAWVLYQGFSRELNLDCLQAFSAIPGKSAFCWRFRIPCGQGEHVLLSLRLEMPAGRNTVRLAFHRHRAERAEGRLGDDVPVRLILRPDIESRSVHEPTKAYTGPEHRFRAAVRERAEGFRFAPDPGPVLDVVISPGRFVLEPQWEYMVHRPADAERGEDPHSDLFSPGYFEAPLAGGDRVILTADAG
ncbi:MAG: glycogen debranching enzyme N-terminal domain-containing protein, partial [Desulfobacterales bacterium]